MRSPFLATADGTQLFHLDWGEGPPVVFVHAWALSSEFWRHPLMDLTDRGLRCVAYDRRGHGRSSVPGAGYDYDTLADDLATVLDTLDVRGVTLVAHSMGGGDVLRYLSRHGAGRVARVAFVALAGPCLRRRDDHPEGVDPAVLEAARARYRADFPAWTREQARAFFTPETSEATVDWGVQLMLQTPLRAVVEAARTMAEADLRPDLRRLELPTLFVHGDRDASIPFPFGQQAARLVPHARFVRYEGAPHGIPVTHAARLTRDLLGFMAET